MKQSIVWSLEKMALPVVIAKCKGEYLAFIIDTGASENCLSYSAYQYFTHKYDDAIVEKNESGIVLGIDGVEMSSRNVSLSFSIGCSEYTEDFVVFNEKTAMEKLKDDCGITVAGILGNVFLVNNHIVIDYGNYTVYTKRKRKKKSEATGKESA